MSELQSIRSIIHRYTRELLVFQRWLSAFAACSSVEELTAAGRELAQSPEANERTKVKLRRVYGFLASALKDQEQSNEHDEDGRND